MTMVLKEAAQEAGRFSGIRRSSKRCCRARSGIKNDAQHLLEKHGLERVCGETYRPASIGKRRA